MNCTIILLFAFCFHVHASALGQRVTIHEDNVPLKKVFRSITRQTGMEFLFTKKVIDQARPVTVRLSGSTLTEALNKCLAGQPLMYEIVNGTVAIQLKKEPEPGLAADTIPQVSGTVTAEGKPLEGVSVHVRNSNKGAFTNAEGEFVLFQVPENSALVFSSVGYESREERVNGRPVINVALPIAVSSLDETVVIGYGANTKRFSTGSISKVKAADIQKQSVNNPLQALQGRVPGLSVTQLSGLPGSPYTVRLRGQNSIGNGNDPLYIIDGTPYPAQPLVALALGANGTASPLNTLNPGEIESIEILKDADATAIYGSRGANGVIIITTKRGAVGKPKLDLNIYAGGARITRDMELLDTKQYLEMRNEAFQNDASFPGAIEPDVDLLYWDTTRYTDWQQKLIGGTAGVLDAQASLSGGSLNTQFLFNGSYHKESTVFPGDFGYSKGSGRLSVTHQSEDKKFRINFSTGYIADKNNLLTTDLTQLALSLPPVAPAAYSDDGQLNWQNGTFENNPYAYIQRRYGSKTSNLLSNAELSYAISDHLIIRLTGGLTRLQVNEVVTNPSASLSPFSSSQRSSAFTNNNLQTAIAEPQIEYRRNSKLGKIIVLAGGAYQYSMRQVETIGATGFSSDALLENLQSASGFYVLSSDYARYKYMAVFGRLTYDWQSKYLVNLTGRRDGSSRFGPGKKFANFGAIGVGWIFTNEKWMMPSSGFLSYGKIRFSYGTTGNDQIGDYKYLDTWSSVINTYEGVSGLQPTRLFNADYGWEVNKKTEVGLELGMFNNKMLFTGSYYRNRSSNQLTGYPLSQVTGFSSIQYNLPAVVQNTGLELELSNVNLKRTSFQWSTQFNISIPSNKLISFPDLEKSGYANSYIVGKPLSIANVSHFIGVDEKTGLLSYEDVNQNGYPFDYPADLQALNSVNQYWFGGLSNTFNYKGWQLDFLFQFVKQTGYNYMQGFIAPGMMSNQPVIVMDRWRNEGHHKTIQKFTSTYSSMAYSLYETAQYLGDQKISDASFIRLKNLSLSYSLNEYFSKKLRITRCVFYIRGQNLITITQFAGMDPENRFTTVLPPLKMLTVGFQITF